MDTSKIIRVGCNACELENGKFRCFSDEDAIKCFWATNLTNQPDKFDFKRNFDSVKFAIRRKLAEHGLRSVEDYREYMEDIYGPEPTFEELQITHRGSYVHIDADELRDNTYEYIVERLREGYEGVGEFEEMEEVLSEINNLQLDGWSNKKKTELFDRSIHLQHVTGEVLDVGIDSLREEFENKIKPYLGDEKNVLRKI